MEYNVTVDNRYSQRLSKNVHFPTCKCEKYFFTSFKLDNIQNILKLANTSSN